MKIKEDLYNKWLRGAYVVATRTQEEYDLFMQWLEDNTDIKWCGGEHPTSYSAYEKYLEETTIALGYSRNDCITYGSEEFHQSKCYQVIEFEDLFTQEPFTQDLRELLKVGYMIWFSNGLQQVIKDEEDLQFQFNTSEKDLTGKGDFSNIDNIFRPKYNGIKEQGWQEVWERKKGFRQYLDLSTVKKSEYETYVTYVWGTYFMGVSTGDTYSEKQISKELYELLKKELGKKGEC